MLASDSKNQETSIKQLVWFNLFLPKLCQFKGHSSSEICFVFLKTLTLGNSAKKKICYEIEELIEPKSCAKNIFQIWSKYLNK